uniref:Diacylglycerol O-acyltransferase n=1 Tax=Kalanchoe fedtschenkoi TaxID=63787 RepID=A0A7N1A581_KALFE
MGYFSRLEKDDEPLTPVGRLFSRRELYQVMNCAVTTAGPVDVPALKAELASSAFTRLPRFTSLFLRHPRTGREYWRKTSLVLDRHVKVIDEDVCTDVNDYLADLAVSCPLPADKPLWEVHILPAQSCVVFRVHHSLGDGVSLMSLLGSLFGDINNIKTTKSTVASRKAIKPALTSKKKSVWELVKMAWFSLFYVLEFILRCLWVKDQKTVVTGGDGVQLWPRKLATASFTLEDMNIVKRSVLPNATINDVMLGVLSSGLSEYMDILSPNATKEGQRITVVAITIHMLSYAGKAEMQILVAKDIIPDPDVLARCFEDALQRMKKSAITTSEAYEKLLC